MSTLFNDISDPCDLDRVQAAIQAGPAPERLVPLEIKRLSIGLDAAAEVADTLRELIDSSEERPRLVILVDRTLILRAGVDLKKILAEELSESYEVDYVALGDEHHLFVDDEALDAATAASAGADAILTIGSGTISDIGKVASQQNNGIPLVTLQTAASVDGFTDNVSVVLRSGVKRTVPSRWPDAVLADLTTIATAPTDLNTAGFGELLSLFPAPSDWELASLCGIDGSFHTTPRDLLFAFVEDPREWAAGVDSGEPAAVKQLTQALAIRGIGTGIAGTTACLSGVEHLVSHMLDMYAGARGLEIGKHGAQVGAASVVAAVVWQVLAERLASETPEPNAPDLAAEEQRVLQAFSHLDENGSLAAECWSDYSSKLGRIGENLEKIRAAVESLREEGGILSRLPDPAMLAESLKLAGSAATWRGLEPWLDADTWEWAIRNCFMMRNRFTVIDLMHAVGWWDEETIAEVLQRVAKLTEGPGN